MKKLVMAFAVAALAVAANAASLKWGFTSEADGVPTGDMTGYTAYLVAAADWDTSDVAGSLGKATDSAAYADWENDNDPSADYYYAAYSATKGGLADSLAGAADYYIVFANDSKYSAVSVNGTIIADGDNTQPTPFQPSTLALDTSTFSSYSGGGGEPVPEPTSGLLMLLGIAGLALRRKAK